MLNLELVSGKNTIILSLKRNLTSVESKNINTYLFPLILKYDIKNIVIDFKKVKKINSSGFNILIKLNWVMKLKKGKVYFTEVPECFESELKKLKFNFLSRERKEVIL